MKFLKIPETVLEVFKPLDNETKGKMFSALEAYDREEKEPDFEGTEKALWISVKYLLKKKGTAKKVVKLEPVMQPALPLAYLPAPKKAEGGDPAEQETFRGAEECSGASSESDNVQLVESAGSQFEIKSLGGLITNSSLLHAEIIPCDETAEETIEESVTEEPVIEEPVNDIKEEPVMDEEDFEIPEEGTYCPVEEPAESNTDEEVAEKRNLEEAGREMYLFYYNTWWDLKNAEAAMAKYEFNENKEHISDWCSAMIKYHGEGKIRQCIKECSRDGWQIAQGFRFDNIKNYFAKHYAAL